MKKYSTIFSVLFALCAAIPSTHAQTAIGGSEPHGSAMLDVQSDSKGVLFPRMTTAERDAIASPALGLMIFNVETGCLEINLAAGTKFWQSVKCNSTVLDGLQCGSGTFNNFPLDPSMDATNQSVTISYTGGDGSTYPQQTFQSTGVTGLTATLAGGTFTNGAGGTLTLTFSGRPNRYGTARFDIGIGGQSCTLEVPLCGAYVGGSSWKVFSCYNLGAAGATTSADPLDPSWELHGDYYQWGRNPTCFGKDFQNPCSSPVYGAARPSAADPNSGSITGWNPSTAPQAPDDAWQDNTKTENDPCPSGYRVPTKSQWQSLEMFNTRSDVGPWTSGPTEYGSGKKIGAALFLPATGTRNTNTGALVSRGAGATYWSSTIGDIAGFSWRVHIIFNQSFFEYYDNPRSLGYNIRCIKEN
jgi:uncharacterized protein (TIGR02145 family)